MEDLFKLHDDVQQSFARFQSPENAGEDGRRLLKELGRDRFEFQEQETKGFRKRLEEMESLDLPGNFFDSEQVKRITRNIGAALDFLESGAESKKDAISFRKALFDTDYNPDESKKWLEVFNRKFEEENGESVLEAFSEVRKLSDGGRLKLSPEGALEIFRKDDKFFRMLDGVVPEYSDRIKAFLKEVRYELASPDVAPYMNVLPREKVCCLCNDEELAKFSWARAPTDAFHEKTHFVEYFLAGVVKLPPVYGMARSSTACFRALKSEGLADFVGREWAPVDDGERGEWQRKWNKLYEFIQACYHQIDYLYNVGGRTIGEVAGRMEEFGLPREEAVQRAIWAAMRPHGYICSYFEGNKYVNRLCAEDKKSLGTLLLSGGASLRLVADNWEKWKAHLGSYL